MRPTLSLTLAAATLISTTSADFLISNSSVCMGSFLVRNCYHGVKVLSGIHPKTDYTCSHLIHAQDNHYISNGTAGPHGDDHLISRGGICDSKNLKFVKDRESYFVNDGDDRHVADCTWDIGLNASCSNWVGGVFFMSMFKCKSSICD